MSTCVQCGATGEAAQARPVCGHPVEGAPPTDWVVRRARWAEDAPGAYARWRALALVTMLALLSWSAFLLAP